MKDQPKEEENALLGSTKAYLLDDVDKKEVDCNSESPEPVVVSSQNGQLLSALIDYDSHDSDSLDKVENDNILYQDTHTTVREINEPLFGRLMKESTSINNKSESSSNSAKVEVTNNLNGENTDHNIRNFPIVSDYDEMLVSETYTEINAEEESQILDTTNVKLAQFLKKDNLLNVLSAAKDDCDTNFSETVSQVQSLYVSDNLDHQVEVETNRNELSKVVPSNDFDCGNEVENIDKEPVRSGALEVQDLAVQKEYDTVEYKPVISGTLSEAVSSYVPESYEPYPNTSAVKHEPSYVSSPVVEEPARVSAPVVHIPAITTAPVVQKVKVNNSRLRPICVYLTKKDPKNLSMISLDYCTNEEKR
jgi:hypothetical protein